MLNEKITPYLWGAFCKLQYPFPSPACGSRIKYQMGLYSFTSKFCIDDITNMKITVKGYVYCTTSREVVTDALPLVREPYTIHRKRQHSLAEINDGRMENIA
jgi:hypothetical protein